MFLTSAQLTQRECKMPRGIVIVILQRTETVTAENWKKLEELAV